GDFRMQPRCLRHRLAFRDSPPAAISTLSLHDALPISLGLTDAIRAIPITRPEAVQTIGLVVRAREPMTPITTALVAEARRVIGIDRKSTRLNSSHRTISYAVFCLKKKTLHPSVAPTHS